VYTATEDHNYHCPYCGKLFKRNIELKRHVRIHTNAKPYCRTHVDTVQTVLEDLTNSTSHISAVFQLDSVQQLNNKRAVESDFDH